MLTRLHVFDSVLLLAGKRGKDKIMNTELTTKFQNILHLEDQAVSSRVTGFEPPLSIAGKQAQYKKAQARLFAALGELTTDEMKQYGEWRKTQ